MFQQASSNNFHFYNTSNAKKIEKKKNVFNITRKKSELSFIAQRY